jgi:hypothetical protein
MAKIELAKMNSAEIQALLKRQAALASASKAVKAQASGYKTKLDALGTAFSKGAAGLAKIDD